MIDEKKIEEAASEYRFNTIAQIHSLSYAHKGTVSQEQIDLEIELIENAFKAGINWFKENLWHDASEEPKENGDILVLCGRKVSYTDTLSADFIKLRGWNNLAENRFIIRWLYIEDLMEGGSNG